MTWTGLGLSPLLGGGRCLPACPPEGEVGFLARGWNEAWSCGKKQPGLSSASGFPTGAWPGLAWPRCLWGQLSCTQTREADGEWAACAEHVLFSLLPVRWESLPHFIAKDVKVLPQHDFDELSGACILSLRMTWGCRTVFLQGGAHLDLGGLLDWQAWLGAVRMALEKEEAGHLRLFLLLSALDLLPLAMAHLVWNSQACTEKWPPSPRCTSCLAR